MKFIRSTIALSTLAMGLTGGAFAQDHHDDHHDDHGGHPYVQHREWRSGYHMQQNDWNRGERVDWNAHHLARPRAGYEWREVDGNYVQAAIATGIIASVIAVSAAH